MHQRKNFENRLIFGEDMDKCKVARFFWRTLYNNPWASRVGWYRLGWIILIVIFGKLYTPTFRKYVIVVQQQKLFMF